MPKIPAKYEDWTPPWTEGEIDEDKVARLVYNLQLSEQTQAAELKTVKKANEELTDANEVFKAASEEAGKTHDDATKKAVAEVTAKFEKENEQLKADLEETQRESDLKDIRIKFPKIDEEDIERLKGETVDELLEDAAKFAEKHGLIEAEGDENEEQQEESTSVVRRQPRVKTPGDPKSGEGAPTDVDKFLADRAGMSAWIS